MKLTKKSTQETINIPELKGILEVLNSQDSKIVINILFKSKLFKKYKSSKSQDQYLIKKLSTKFEDTIKKVKVELWDEIKYLKVENKDELYNSALNSILK